MQLNNGTAAFRLLQLSDAEAMMPRQLNNHAPGSTPSRMQLNNGTAAFRLQIMVSAVLRQFPHQV